MTKADNRNSETGGVLVLRAWSNSDGELIARLRWSTVDDERGSTVLGSAGAVMREVKAFLERAVGHDDVIDAPNRPFVI